MRSRLRPRRCLTFSAGLHRFQPGGLLEAGDQWHVRDQSTVRPISPPTIIASKPTAPQIAAQNPNDSSNTRISASPRLSLWFRMGGVAKVLPQRSDNRQAKRAPT
jgi:hypothetical protein